MVKASPSSVPMVLEASSKLNKRCVEFICSSCLFSNVSELQGKAR